MVKVTDPFVLRAETTNHSQDVRYVAPSGNSCEVLSASRDKTARVFSFTNEANDGFHDVLTPVGNPLEGHTAFVNFVLYHPSVPFLDNEPAIVTGSNDKYIILWNPTQGSMEAIMGGHSDAVKCATIVYPSMDIVSGGWDKSGVVWDITTGGIKQLFNNHEQGILGIAQVGARTEAANQLVVTCSGDRRLICWDTETATVKNIFKGHTDSVQSVCAIGDGGRFASAGNDGRIGIWHYNVATPLFFLQAHESLVFSVCYLSATNELATAADDRTVKVWGIDDETNSLVCTQVINFPTTVWSVAAVADGAGAYTEGLVTGTADGAVRLWTRNLDLCAGPEKIDALYTSVQAQRIDVKALQAAGYKLDMAGIPLLSACNDIEGQYEGERKLFKLDDDTVEMYTWASGTWEKIGSIVMGDNQQVFKGVIPKQRFFFDGQEWDYLFDIDFGGGRTVKLPYNSGESVFDAAQRFINNNSSIGAQQHHKEAIQNHIMQGLSEEDLAKIGVVSMSGGSGAVRSTVAYSAYAQEAAELARQGIRETPSWGQAKKQFESGGNDVAFSTFAQEEAEAKAAAARAAVSGGTPTGSPTGAAGSGSSPTGGSSNGLVFTAVERFTPFDAAVVKKKTGELAGSANLYDGAIDAAVAAVAGPSPATLAAASAGIAQLFTALEAGSRFPAIDTLRYIASTPTGGAYVSSADAACSELLESSLVSTNAFDANGGVLTSDAERLVTLRLFANIVAAAGHNGGAPTTTPTTSSPPVDGASFSVEPSLIAKLLDNGVRPMAKRPTINNNQKSAVLATLQNIAVRMPSLIAEASASEVTSVVDALTPMVKSFFVGCCEAILAERDVATQTKLLMIAYTAVYTVVGAASSTAATAPTIAAPIRDLVRDSATRSLQRFCQGSLRHIDRQLAAVANALYVYVKPAVTDDE